MIKKYTIQQKTEVKKKFSYGKLFIEFLSIFIVLLSITFYFYFDRITDLENNLNKIFLSFSSYEVCEDIKEVNLRERCIKENEILKNSKDFQIKRNEYIKNYNREFNYLNVDEFFDVFFQKNKESYEFLYYRKNFSSEKPVLTKKQIQRIILAIEKASIYKKNEIKTKILNPYQLLGFTLFILISIRCIIFLWKKT